MDDPEAAPPDVQLNGWKGIAAYLGKSVRAAQRWERELGLPVRRIKTPTGQIVYADKRDIAEWRRRMEARPGALFEGSSDQTDAQGRPPFSRTQLGVVAVAVTALAVAVVGWIGTRRSTPVGELQFQLREGAIEARTATGQLAWTYRFSEPVGTSGYEGQHFQQVDIDGDGATEVLAVIRPGNSVRGHANSVALYCLSHTGQLRWSFTPDFVLTFDGRRFAGPWQLHDLALSSGPGRREIWLAVGHHTWWPGVVVRISPTGRPRVQFVQSGRITALGFWSTPAGVFVVAGGVNNEYAQASVAILRPDDAPSVSPQTLGSGFHCEGCPQGAVRRYFLLPRTEVSRSDTSLPHSMTHHLTSVGGAVKVVTRETADGGAGAIFFLDPGMHVREMALNDQYWAVHRQFEREGRITHAADDCPERTIERQLRVWAPGDGWRTEPIGAPDSAVPGDTAGVAGLPSRTR